MDDSRGRFVSDKAVIASLRTQLEAQAGRVKEAENKIARLKEAAARGWYGWQELRDILDSTPPTEKEKPSKEKARITAVVTHYDDCGQDGGCNPECQMPRKPSQEKAKPLAVCYCSCVLGSHSPERCAECPCGKHDDEQKANGQEEAKCQDKPDIAKGHCCGDHCSFFGCSCDCRYCGYQKMRGGTPPLGGKKP